MLSMVNRIRNEVARMCLKLKQCPLQGGAEKGDIPGREDAQGRGGAE